MYVEREINEKFHSLTQIYNIVAIIGPRQAGKTTFLKERIKGLNASYVMLDDPDARSFFDEDIKKFEGQYIEGKEITVIDEVQYGTEAGSKLKYLADRGRKIWVTSSSETLLAKEVFSWLVGRVGLLKLYPFSLNEFFKAKGQKEINDDITKRAVWEHAVYGGYPKVVLSEGSEIKVTLLKDLYTMMILKDVAHTFSIADVRSVEELTKYFSHSIGNLLVYEKTSGDMKISFSTVKKYIDAMEKSYLISLVQPFFTNKLKELTKQPKVYFIDSGLRNAIANTFPASLENEGKLFENYVFSEIIKLGLKVRYWRTKTDLEVDFIVEKDGMIVPVEVKLRAEPEKIERSLRTFIRTYKPKLAVVVFYDGKPGEILFEGCRVIFTNVPGLLNILKIS